MRIIGAFWPVPTDTHAPTCTEPMGHMVAALTRPPIPDMCHPNIANTRSFSILVLDLVSRSLSVRDHDAGVAPVR